MTISITYYGTNNNYWNAGPASGPAAKDASLNINSNSSLLNWSLNFEGAFYTGTLKGSFQFNGPISTLDKVSGTLTEFTSFKNGVLFEHIVITQSADLHAYLFPPTSVAQYISHASILNSGVTFVGAQGGQQWGDTLIAGSGNDSFTSYGGKITTPNAPAYFDGKGGTDVAIMQGRLSEYTIQTKTVTDQTDMSYRAQVSGWEIRDSVVGRNGVTHLVNVERVQFSDKAIAFDLSPNQASGNNSVSITTYGSNNGFWNAGPSDGNTTPKDVSLSPNSNASTLNFSLRSDGNLYEGVFKGNYQFNGPISSLDKASGLTTEATIYKNGSLGTRIVFTQGTDIKSWFFSPPTVPEYISQASALNGGVTFVGSQGGQEWGDTLIAGSGNDSFTSYAGKITTPNNAYFDGKGGTDVAIMQGRLSEYTIQTKTFTDQTDMSYRAQISGWEIRDSVAGRNGVTQLVNVERVQFADKAIAFDLSPNQAGGTPTPITPAPTPITPITPITPTTPVIVPAAFQTTNTISVPTGSLTSNSTAANDLITGNTATNVVDSVAYKGSIKDYKVAMGSNGNYTVVDAISTRDGSDVVVNVERLKFSPDPSTGANRIALDLNPTQASGKAALLIGVVLPGKLALDASKYQLMGTVIDLFDQGFSLQQLSGALLRLPIWDILTGKPSPTNADIATYLVNNVYGATSQTANLGADLARSLAISAMNAETPATQGTYLATLATSTASQSHIDLVGIQATGLMYLG